MTTSRRLAVLGLIVALGCSVGLWFLNHDSAGKADTQAKRADQATSETKTVKKAAAPPLATLKRICAGPQAQQLRRFGISCQQVQDAAEVVEAPTASALPQATPIDGKDGKDGRDGLDGRTPTKLEVQAAVAVCFATGDCPAPDPGQPGKDGRDGVDGKNGTDGKDGVDGTPGQPGTATPGSYTCPSGQYLEGFTVAVAGDVTLDCQLLPSLVP
ncbi:MAG: hypothetical protein JWO46_1793 [Nocardioidaceae bacterium]|nr:hypothetical protein [Nocardioidaceae bacterium]